MLSVIARMSTYIGTAAAVPFLRKKYPRTEKTVVLPDLGRWVIVPPSKRLRLPPLGLRTSVVGKPRHDVTYPLEAYFLRIGPCTSCTPVASLQYNRPPVKFRARPPTTAYSTDVGAPRNDCGFCPLN